MLYVALLALMYVGLPTWAILAAEPAAGKIRRVVQAAVVAAALIEAMTFRTIPSWWQLALGLGINAAFVVWGHWVGRKSQRHDAHKDRATAAVSRVKPVVGAGGAGEVK